MTLSRRDFLKFSGALTGSALLPHSLRGSAAQSASSPRPDYAIDIAVTPLEIAPNRILSTTTYNGQFPGPLLRFKEGQPVTVEIRNHTDVPEQLHWHGQFVPAEVDGASEEGTPFVPARGSRTITFTPRPSGFRFYHTHNRAAADLAAGQYSGQVGPVYIEPKADPGAYDREVFLVLKEFQPTLSRGGDMPQTFLAPATLPELERTGESAMKASLAKGMPESFTINGRMLGHGEPIRVKPRERVLFHILNGSATEIRSLALPGHTFRILALDGNLLPAPRIVPVLWLGTAERISALVELNHPGIWVLGDLEDDDRRHGMGIVVEYANQKGSPVWLAPPRIHWNYAQFGSIKPAPAAPDETFDLTFAKDNAAEQGFNRWTINGVSYPMNSNPAPAAFHLKEGRRYRLRLRNASDDIHPIHLHRHSFELTRIAGRATAGVMKDIVMLGGYQEAEIDFVANNPGATLFHCHQQLHMDFGFMALFDYV
jgi:FtsP/CotA-like multicopper oxidase with cupredoxin domain